MGEEWLKSGKCPFAKSYRAVSSGNCPFLTKRALPGSEYRCPRAIVAVRSALSKTAFTKNLRPQPLAYKILVIGVLCMAANVPLGAWREHTEKFSPAWFAAVHAAVPFIAMIRKSVLMPKTAMAFTIGGSVLGQVIGSRAQRHSRLNKNMVLVGVGPQMGLGVAMVVVWLLSHLIGKGIVHHQWMLRGKLACLGFFRSEALIL